MQASGAAGNTLRARADLVWDQVEGGGDWSLLGLARWSGWSGGGGRSRGRSSVCRLDRGGRRWKQEQGQESCVQASHGGQEVESEGQK